MEGRARRSSFPPFDRPPLIIDPFLLSSTTLLYYDYQPSRDCRPRRRLPTSQPPTYLLVYFVVAVCYQVSTFATVPSSFSLTRPLRFIYLYVVASV